MEGCIEEEDVVVVGLGAGIVVVGWGALVGGGMYPINAGGSGSSLHLSKPQFPSTPKHVIMFVISLVHDGHTRDNTHVHMSTALQSAASVEER
jgi:hypothetical protein